MIDEAAKGDAERLKQIGARIGLSFPPSSRLQFTNDERGLDDAVRVKVTMTASDYEGFIASSPLSGAPLALEKRFFLGKNQGAWDPEAPKELPTGQVRLPNASVLNLGVDRSGGGQVVVFVFWHET